MWHDIKINNITEGLIKYTTDEYLNKEYGLYPYLANIDIIINITDYINSNMNINQYNQLHKNCIMTFE